MCLNLGPAFTWCLELWSFILIMAWIWIIQWLDCRKSVSWLHIYVKKYTHSVLHSQRGIKMISTSERHAEHLFAGSKYKADSNAFCVKFLKCTMCNWIDNKFNFKTYLKLNRNVKFDFDFNQFCLRIFFFFLLLVNHLRL